jgi:hypothetical protein
MFPFAMINASLMLRNNKNKIKTNPPMISTLPDYIKITKEEFYGLLIEKSKKVGVFEMVDMINNWMHFDDLTEKQKIRFVTETINPEYYSIKNRLKRLLKKI